MSYPPDRLTKPEVAKALLVSLETVDAWEKLGVGPEFVEIATPEGMRRAYPADALCRFIERHTMTPTKAMPRLPTAAASPLFILGGAFTVSRPRA